jgi:membrane-associated phospholipid phosphatase
MTHRHVWLCLYFPFYIALFFTVEALSPADGYWVTDLPFDAKIPFVPQMVWAYCLFYFLFAVVGIPLLIGDGPAFRRWMYFLMTTFTITLVFDALVPNMQTLRPTDFVPAGISERLLALIWSVDTPTNVFPSMHVLGCIGNGAAVLDSRVFRRWQKWVILILSAVCSVSTVFVKQHAIIDTVGALAFAVPIILVFYGKRIKESIKSWKNASAAEAVHLDN